jgi:hypothetical protein
MPFDEALAQRIRAALTRRRNVGEKQMFGGVGFLLNGHLLVGVWEGSLIARVGPGGYEDALLGPHVREFGITGRAMRGWVLVGPGGVKDDEQLGGWIDRAVKFVRALPAK